jgi:HPt (histidine-containing phosphotransfer) domain-containing protein
MSIELDFNALHGISALQRPNKPNLLERIVHLFESESPRCIEQVLQGVKVEDLESIRIGAHSLKSSSANVGAVSLSVRCRELEQAARKGNFARCALLSEGLQAEFEESAASIRMFLKQAA